MLKKHESIWLGKLLEIHIFEHRVDLQPNVKPFKSPPFRSQDKRVGVSRNRKQLKSWVIEPALSEWAAPVLIAPKQDLRLRFCVDYRKLSTMTKNDSYPLPWMGEWIRLCKGGGTCRSLKTYNPVNVSRSRSLAQYDHMDSSSRSHPRGVVKLRYAPALRNAKKTQWGAASTISNSATNWHGTMRPSALMQRRSWKTWTFQ